MTPRTPLFRLLLAVFLFVSASAATSSSPDSPAGASNQYQYGGYSYTYKGEIPSWVKPTKIPKPKGKPGKQGAEYLLVDTQIFTGNGQHEKYFSTSTRLNTSQGVAEGSELHIDFNPDYQELIIHNIRIHRKGKALDTVKPQHIRLLQREEDLKNGIMHGLVSAIAIIPDTRVGDRIDSSYTVIGRNPVYGDKIFGSFGMDWGVDIRLVNARLLVPSDIEFQIKKHNTSLKGKVKKSKGVVEYRWQSKNVKAVNYEDNYPPWFSPYAWIEYSEYKTWSDVELWARSLYGSIDQSSKELGAEIKKLKKGTKDGTGFASKALEFTQEDIRYLGMEFGVNSHLPHSPAHVLGERYGDCKDKSNLLVQLLKSHNIEAYSALVSHRYRDGIENFLPSPSAFDHVIVNAIIDGKSIWLDPTRTFQSDSVKTLGFMNFGKALKVGHEWDTELVDVAPLATQESKVRSTEHFKYSGLDKPTFLTVTTKYSGALAEFQRSYFGTSSVEQIRTNYLNYYAKFYPKIEMLGEVNISDDLISNTLVVTDKYKITDFSTVADQSHRANFYAQDIAYYLVNPEKRLRDGPLQIGYPKEISQKIIVDFSKDVGLTLDTRPYFNKNSEFDYWSRNAYYSNRFEFSSNLVFKKSWVAATGVEDFLAQVDIIKKDIDFSLTFNWSAPLDEDGDREGWANKMRGISFE